MPNEVAQQRSRALTGCFICSAVCLGLVVGIVLYIQALRLLGFSRAAPTPRARFAAHSGNPHANIKTLSVSLDGALLLIGDSDQTTLWRTAPLQCLRVFPGRGGVLSPDGQRVAAVVPRSGQSPAGRWLGELVKIFDARTGGEVLALEHADGDGARSMAFSPRGDILAVGTMGSLGTPGVASLKAPGAIYLWDAVSGNLKRKLTGPKGPCNTVAFAPDGRSLATGGHDGSVRIFDMKNGRVIFQLQGHSGPVWEVTFGVRGKRLASNSSSRAIVWDTENGARVLVIDNLDKREDMGSSVALHPLDPLLAVGGHRTGRIGLRDIRNGKEVKILRSERESQPVDVMLFLPDGRTLAAAVGIGDVELWNVGKTDGFR